VDSVRAGYRACALCPLDLRVLRFLRAWRRGVYVNVRCLVTGRGAPGSSGRTRRDLGRRDVPRRVRSPSTVSLPYTRVSSVGVSAQKVEVFKKGSRADFLHYTASIVMVDHGSTRIPLGGRLFTLIYSNIHTKILAAGKNE